MTTDHTADTDLAPQAASAPEAPSAEVDDIVMGGGLAGRLTPRMADEKRRFIISLSALLTEQLGRMFGVPVTSAASLA